MWERICRNPEEQIVTGTPFELAKMEFAPLAVLLFENPNPETRVYSRHGR